MILRILFTLLIICITAASQVGIGTTSPSEELDIESNGATNTSAFSIGVDNDDSDKLKIGTTALETNTRLTIDASGNFGIGVTTPAVFNDSHSAVDFRVEGDTDPGLFFVDGSADMVGVSTQTPSATLNVKGSATFNKGNGDNDFQIEGQIDGSMSVVDASIDMIGISTNSPTSILDIQGSLTLKQIL